MIFTDLTLEYSEDIQGFSISPAKDLETDGWNATTLKIYSHSGTHMDAPVHFGVNNQTINQFEVSDFYCQRTWVLDLSHVTESYLIEVSDLGEVANQIKQGDSLLFRTDWYKKIGNDSYRNGLPRISEGLAKWLVDAGVKLIGVEPPSVADVNNLPEVTLIHRILLGNVIIVEGLCHLDKLKSEMVTFIALPLKIKGGDGSPCRAIAIENLK
jgi:arylformamidase